MAHPRSQAGGDALSVMLREATSSKHHEAERRPFMRRFFRSEVGPEPYTAYLARLWFVYQALEEEAAKLADDAGLGAMVFPELTRLPGLEADLAVFVGTDWRSTISPSPVAEAYAARLRWCGSEFPPGWVAHGWVRYLGMLGGQAQLRKIVSKACAVAAEGPGVAFYEFPAVPVEEVGPFFRRFHGALDGLELDEESKTAVAAEGNVAFQFNMDLTDELAADFSIVAPAGPADELDALKQT